MRPRCLGRQRALTGGQPRSPRLLLQRAHFTTVGFGNVVPVGTAAHTLVAFESFLGLFGFPLVTGLRSARFSRPATRLRFSRLGVLQTRGSAALLFRVTNTSRTEVVQVEASATVAVVDVSDPSARRYLTHSPSKTTELPCSHSPGRWCIARLNPDGSKPSAQTVR